MPDIIERVIRASHEDQSIDWKMAFFDIQIITQDVKSSLERDSLKRHSLVPPISCKVIVSSLL